MVKLSYYHSAVFIFQDYDFCIFVINGKRHLRSALGSPSFITSFLILKASLWEQKLSLKLPMLFLSMVLLKHVTILLDELLTYLGLFATFNGDHLLEVLPNLTGQSSFSDVEQNLLSHNQSRWIFLLYSLVSILLLLWTVII